MPEVSFTKKVKSEIALVPFEEKALKPILAGMVRISGTIMIGKTNKLKIKTEIASLAKFLFNAFKTIYGVSPYFRYVKKMQFDKSIVYNLIIDEKVDVILEDLECYHEFERMKPREMVKVANIRGFVIGLFLGGGMVSNPNKSHYYLELTFNDEEDAELVLKKLLAFKDDRHCNFKMTKRREKYVLYLKRGDEISMFLAYLGAQYAMMDFENARLTKDYINNQNRLDICSNANYTKSKNNGEKNLLDIELIEKKIGFFAFDDKTRAAIEIRKDNPDDSYSEIAQKMVERSIVITKSGVVHIFTKLHALAEKLKG